MDEFLKIVNSLEQSCLLKKGVSETIKNEAKKEKGEFVGMLLGASLLRNLLEGTIREGRDL